MKSILISKCALAAAALCLSACGQSPQNSGSQHVAQHSVSQHNHGDGMRLGSDYQKPGAPVRMQANYDGRTELAEAELITLSFVPNFDLEAVSIQVRSSSEELAVSAESYSGPGTGGNAIEVPVSVRSDQEGRYYLNVAVNTEHQGIKSGRAFALAVVVGDPPLEKASAPMDSNGEPIRVFNAEETKR